VPLHPTQLYEAGMNLVIFVILFRLRRSRRPGLLLPWFLLLYGAGRGLLEFLRGDAAGHLALGPVTVSQLLCIATALVAAALLFRIRSFCPPERRF
jgi:phosphatidylglycerol:prolipoprotein diacylglycerol transferase